MIFVLINSQLVENIFIYRNVDHCIYDECIPLNSDLDRDGVLWENNITQFHLFFPSYKDSKQFSCLFIFPGGGYRKLSMMYEGEEVAIEAVRNGMIAIVVQYRLPEGDFEISIEEFYDLLWTLYRDPISHIIDWDSLHIMGFSAGAHFAGMIAHKLCLKSFCIQKHIDWSISYLSVAMIYPVISTEASYADKGCVKRLLGERKLIDRFNTISLERLNHELICNSFVLYAEDDTRILPKNAIDYINSIKEQHLPINVLKLKEGGHGFGLGKHLEKPEEWFDKYIKWLKFIPQGSKLKAYSSGEYF